MEPLDFLSAGLNLAVGALIAYVILWVLADVVKRIAERRRR